MLAYFFLKRRRRVGAEDARSANGSQEPILSGATSEGEKKDEGPITSTDAALMAEAFRQALRKPAFVESNDTSPGEVGEVGEADAEGDGDRRGREIMGRELASEGRSTRSVKGMKWGGSS